MSKKENSVKIALSQFGCVAALGAMLALGACSSGGDSSSSSTSSVGLSGTLSLSSSSTSKASAIPDSQVSASTIDLSTYRVVCTTQTTPPTTTIGSIDSSGNFNVSIDGASNQPLSCSMIDSSDTKVADFLISDSSSKTLGGSSTSYTDSATYKSSASLGSISYDSNAGEVVIPKSTISSSLNTTIATPFDPTGTWKIAAVDFTQPKGTTAPCAEGTNNCDGPSMNQSLYIKLWSGTKTEDSSSVYGLQLWQSEASAKTCGTGSAPVVGLSSAEKTAFGVDFSANGSADTQFSFPTAVAASSGFQDSANNNSQNAVTLTARSGITEPAWQMSTAKTRYDMTAGCSMTDVTVSGVTYHAFMCGPDDSSPTLYMFNLTGGCVNTSTNAPVQVTDWSNINSCSNSTNSSTGVHTTTCTGTSGSTAVTCTNKWMISHNADGSSPDANNSHSFNWSALTTVSAGTSCTNGSLSALDKLKCYADYYWASGLSNYSGACVPRIQTDWTATTAADFIHVDVKPSSLIFFEEYKPFPDGTGGTLTSRQKEYRGVAVSANNYVSCEVINTGALTLRKKSDTKILAQYQSSTITTNTNKPACQAAFTGARTTYLFYLTK